MKKCHYNLWIYGSNLTIKKIVQLIKGDLENDQIDWTKLDSENTTIHISNNVDYEIEQDRLNLRF